MANAANAVERARLREIAADADQFDLRFRRLMEVATDSNSAPRASGDLKADAKSYGEDPVWMPDWSEPVLLFILIARISCLSFLNVSCRFHS
jgi:hypothetical protein